LIPVSLRDGSSPFLVKIRARGAPYPLAFGTGVPHARLHPLHDQGPLEFSHGTDNLEHQAPRGCAQVQVVSEADESHAPGFEFGQGIDEVAKRSAESVELPDQPRVEAPRVGLGHEPVEFRPRVLGPGHPGVRVLPANLPPAALTELA
jgi:hypothetical protein